MTNLPKFIEPTGVRYGHCVNQVQWGELVGMGPTSFNPADLRLGVQQS